MNHTINNECATKTRKGISDTSTSSAVSQLCKRNPAVKKSLTLRTSSYHKTIVIVESGIKLTATITTTIIAMNIKIPCLALLLYAITTKKRT